MTRRRAPSTAAESGPVLEPAPGRRPVGALLGLLLVLAGGGLFLVRFAGAPRAPGRVPEPAQVWQVLAGADVPLDAAQALLAALAGCCGCGSLRRLPCAWWWRRPERSPGGPTGWRRWAPSLTGSPCLWCGGVVDGAVVAGVVVQLTARIPVAAAAPLEGPPGVVAPDAALAAGAGPDEALAARRGRPAPVPGYAVYTVRPGDSLWAIAARQYGSGRVPPDRRRQRRAGDGGRANLYPRLASSAPGGSCACRSAGRPGRTSRCVPTSSSRATRSLVSPDRCSAIGRPGRRSSPSTGARRGCRTGAR